MIPRPTLETPEKLAVPRSDLKVAATIAAAIIVTWCALNSKGYQTLKEPVEYEKIAF